MLQLIKIRCGHTHSAKASLQSSGFHGKLITIIRPLITSSLSIRQRNLLFVTFILLSHPLCQNKPPKRLHPGLCLPLAPFHHNYTAEQNQAPALERVHQTSNILFHNRLQEPITFLGRAEWSPCVSLHMHLSEIYLSLLFLLCPSRLADFSHSLDGPKSKNAKQMKIKEQSCIKLDLGEKATVLCGSSPWRILCPSYQPTVQERHCAFLFWGLGFFSC